MASPLDSVSRRARAWANGRVVGILGERSRQLSAAHHDLATVRAGIGTAERRASDLLHRHDRAPFHGGMTVHAALARHPRVADALARRGLPGCAWCAVGTDETLTEAAFAEGFDAVELVTELNQLAHAF
jgi:hypothetical protein